MSGAVSMARGKRSARSRSRAEVPSGFRVEEAYRHLKTRIMSAELPPGGTVNEQAIAEALGISRTPVREAIRRLEQEGLVIRYPNRGALVTRLSMKDVIEIWQMREILEPAACRLAASRVDQTALAGVEKVIRELQDTVGPDYETHLRSDLELHRLILEATGNTTLRQVVEMLNERIVQVRIVNSPGRFHKSVAEHLEIIGALRTGDGAAAAEAMRRHLANARESLYLLA
jgi:DNA-binding GntR family transcriptional regulator